MHVRSTRPHFPLASAARLAVSAAGLDATDEGLAALSNLPLLITAPTRGQVDALAMRIHLANRAPLPFVRVSVGALATEPEALAGNWAALLERARGGSLLMTDVEAMPVGIQERVVDLVDQVQLSRPSPAAVRLMSGTTTSLLNRIAAGTFSARLFYRLNTLHLIAGPE